MTTVPPPSDAPVVLIVDDEPGLREVLSITIRREGYNVVTAAGVKPALEAIEQREHPFPLVITDLVMPGGSGMDVLAAAIARSEHTQVIVMTAYSTIESAIDAMRSGAYDFVSKPFSPAEMAALATKAMEKSAIVEENRLLRAQIVSLHNRDEPLSIFGDEPAMKRIAALVSKAASTRTTVLITGESGTGKERVARTLHQLSSRADGPFRVINCGALPEALMESELFGHERGAFTGAAQASEGLFRDADGGTLLLDEIGELPLTLQVKLLRVIQEKKVRPVGGTREIPVDVRVVAATNRDVEGEVNAGRFRQDLYYRLNVIRVELPPLRDRRSDIRRLSQRMVERFAREFGSPVTGLTPEALRALEEYRFPGNIRELENIIERAVALATTERIGVDDLPDQVGSVAARNPLAISQLPEQGCNLDEVLETTERNLLHQALDRTGGVRKHAAELLGITFRSLRYRLAKLGMASDDDDKDGAESL